MYQFKSLRRNFKILGLKYSAHIQQHLYQGQILNLKRTIKIIFQRSNQELIRKFLSKVGTWLSATNIYLEKLVFEPFVPLMEGDSGFNNIVIEGFGVNLIILAKIIKFKIFLILEKTNFNIYINYIVHHSGVEFHTLTGLF